MPDMIETAEVPAVEAKSRGVQIRLVDQLDDALALIPLGARQHAESVYRDFPFNPNKIARQVEKWFGEGSISQFCSCSQLMQS